MFYLPERTLLGSCELHCVLGRGGGGISYLAYDGVLSRPVVIKEHFPIGLCLRSKNSAFVEALDDELYEQSLATFCQEAQLLANLKHPNIVRVHDIFESSGTAYIIMDYAEGRSLTDWLPDHADDYPTVRQLLCRLLHTLDYLHNSNILHRDIKPGNIIVQPDGNPILLDFGAAHIGATDRTLTVIGSPGYAAPEQFSPHGRCGPWSDLYGLAQSFLQLLPEQARRRYPRHFMATLQRAAQPEPKDRPQTAAEWLQHLNRYPMHRLLWGAGITTLAIGAALALWQFYPAPSHPEPEQHEQLTTLLQAEVDRYSQQLSNLTARYKNPPAAYGKSMTEEEYNRERTIIEQNYRRNIDDIKRQFKHSGQTH